MKKRNIALTGLGLLIGTGATVKAIQYIKNKKESKEETPDFAEAYRVLRTITDITGTEYFIGKEGLDNCIDEATTTYLNELGLIDSNLYKVYLV